MFAIQLDRKVQDMVVCALLLLLSASIDIKKEYILSPLDFLLLLPLCSPHVVLGRKENWHIVYASFAFPLLRFDSEYFSRFQSVLLWLRSNSPVKAEMTQHR